MLNPPGLPTSPPIRPRSDLPCPCRESGFHQMSRITTIPSLFQRYHGLSHDKVPHNTCGLFRQSYICSVGTVKRRKARIVEIVVKRIWRQTALPVETGIAYRPRPSLPRSSHDFALARKHHPFARPHQLCADGMHDALPGIAVESCAPQGTRSEGAGFRISIFIAESAHRPRQAWWGRETCFCL